MKLFFKNLVVGLLLGVSVLTVTYVLSISSPQSLNKYAMQASYVRMFV